MDDATHEVLLVAGTGNLPLARAVADGLQQPLAACTIRRYPDGEVAVELEQSVRGLEVVLLQPTAPPVNDNLVELLALADACRRAAAARVVAAVPYFGYARGDKRGRRRVPVMARLSAELLEAAGVHHVLTLDVHSQQLEGFFRIPVDVLTAAPVLCAAVRERLAPETVVVSPDLGAVRLATDYGQRLGLPVAICGKRRLDGATVEVSQVIGDVRGRPCLIVDDMITTGNTVVEAVRALRAAEAADDIIVVATHGVLAAGAADRLFAAGVRDVVVTDTVPATPESMRRGIRVVPVGSLLAAAIDRLRLDRSLSEVAAGVTAATEPVHQRSEP
jgi:ribose-phosphate pyrophosphokinase